MSETEAQKLGEKIIHQYIRKYGNKKLEDILVNNKPNQTNKKKYLTNK